MEEWIFTVIDITENYFNKEIWEEVKLEVYKCASEHKFGVSNFLYPENIISPIPILIYDIQFNNPELFQKLCDYDVDKMGVNYSDKFVHKVIRFFSPGSYMNESVDSNESEFYTHFLNEEWNENWGGFFTYKNDSYHSILPESNKLIKYDYSIPNQVTPTINNPPMLITLQTTVTSKNFDNTDFFFG